MCIRVTKSQCGNCETLLSWKIYREISLQFHFQSYRENGDFYWISFCKKMVRVKLFNFHTVQNLQMQWQTTCYKRWLWQCGDQPCRQRRCQLETILRKAWQRSTTTKTENEAFFVGKPKSWFSNVLERFLFLSAHMHQHLIYLPKRRFFKIDLCSEIKQISFFTTVSIFHQNMSVNCGYCFRLHSLAK